MIQKTSTHYVVVEQENEIIGHAFLEEKGIMDKVLVSR
jgi:hypothetical protein